MASGAGLLSYTFELRDTGDYGFILPKDEIVHLGEEIWAAMRLFIPFVLSTTVETPGSPIASITETTTSSNLPEATTDLELLLESSAFILTAPISFSAIIFALII
jgi:hypothetical protein